ncbi:hypothetical protein NPIL_499461 [Nephila pilipes]|uniref:Uncharacterized protein n=1 Tax=Nephila pilipes TaxID=299642 RepID=A0A8X6P1S6_NEPPI|nr:hypothetical protein NPIL_499461 [Nephila pilipes]
MVGLKVANEIFGMKIKEAFENIPGPINIADYILIQGKDEIEHDKKPYEISRNMQKRKKCDAITSIGLKISSAGIRSDPVKTKGIIQIK